MDPKKFLPFFASCNQSSILRFFFTLFDSKRYKHVAALYLSAPNWTPSQHPYFQEPSELEELGHLVRDLYGLETLFRISLISHPCREPLIFLDLATDRVLLTTPILQASHRFQMDKLVAAAFRPFYAGGKGKVMCSLCLFRISEDQFTPVFSSGPNSASIIGSTTFKTASFQDFSPPLSTTLGSTKPTACGLCSCHIRI
jgi:hypothetical protein